MNLNNLQASLNLNLQNFASAINQAMRQVRNLGNNMNNQMNNNRNGVNNLNGSVRQLSSSFKDLDRIVSGIMMSQAFYGATNAIQSASSAVVEFSNNMEQAEIAMKYFLGSKEEAKEFITVMQDFAATTPFSTEQALEGSRRLMAMGFNPENVKSIMTIMTDAASATGATADQMNRVTLALGQMKTNGYIAGQELRQLAEAGIPAYKILQEELGLTAEQLKKIGKLKIDGDLGVAAILKGMQQRYKGAADEISMTLGGMWNTVKDDALIASREIFEAPYNALKDLVGRVRNVLEDVRMNLVKGGIGGVFENMVPPELKQSLKLVAAGFIMLGQAMKNVWDVFKPVANTLFTSLITGLGQVLPVIGAVAKAVTAFAAAVIQASPVIRTLAAAILALVVANIAAKALMFLWSVTRLGMVCAAVGQAVMYLGRAIEFVAVVAARSGLARVLLVLTAIVTYLAYRTGVLSTALDKLGAQIASFGGVDLDGLFKPEDNKSLDDMASKWNEQFEQMNDNLKDVGKNADKAGKKVKDKFVAAFDELYQIPDQLDDVDNELEGIGDMTMPGLDLSTGLEDAGKDVREGIESWFDPKWWESFLVRLIPKEKPPSEGGGEGGGGTLPGPPALPAPAADLTAVERMQKAYRDALNEIEQGVQRLTGAFNTFNAAVFGWAAQTKDVFDGTLSVVKSFISGFVGGFNEALETVKSFGSGVLGGMQGVGQTLVDWAVGATVTITEWAGNFGSGVMSGVQSALGAISGFTTGAIAGIGNFVTTTVTLLGTWGSQVLTTIGNFTTNAFNAVSTWVTSTASSIANWATTTYGQVNNWAYSAFTRITTWTTSTAGALATWATSTYTTVANWATTVGDNIKVTTAAVVSNIKLWVSGTSTVIKNWVTTTAGNIFKWAGNIGENVASGLEATANNVSLWATSTAGSLATWATTTAGNVKAWAGNVADNITSFASSTADSIATWAGNLGTNFAGLFTSLGQHVYNWASNSLSNIRSWAQNAWDMIKSVGDAIGDTFGAGSGADITNPLTAPIVLAAGFNAVKQSFGSWSQGVELAVTGLAVTGGLGGFIRPALQGLLGLETGGIVDKEQIIRIGEGNKREAVIPMENSTYMKPFSAAVASDLAEMLGSATTHPGTQADTRPILYVGTLIADDKSLKELYRKMEVIQISEEQRKGR